jgi:hypothetical protein
VLFPWTRHHVSHQYKEQVNLLIRGCEINILNWATLSIPEFSLILISSWMKSWLLTVVPKHIASDDTFRNMCYYSEKRHDSNRSISFSVLDFFSKVAVFWVVTPFWCGSILCYLHFHPESGDGMLPPSSPWKWRLHGILPHHYTSSQKRRLWPGSL